MPTGSEWYHQPIDVNASYIDPTHLQVRFNGYVKVYADKLGCTVQDARRALIGLHAASVEPDMPAELRYIMDARNPADIANEHQS